MTHNGINITDLSARLEERLCARLFDQIRPLLTGRPAAVQGFVLLKLMAEWVAALPPETAVAHLDTWLVTLPRAIEQAVRNKPS